MAFNREQAETQFHNIMFMIHEYVDPAFSFITYRFNRTVLKQPNLDMVCYVDRDGIPTLGINYERFVEYPPLAQIGIIEHTIGHFISGHVATRLGVELQRYCINRYGHLGQQLYTLAVECVADYFVSNPEAFAGTRRPYYDATKLGLEKWDGTISVLRRLEELVVGDENPEEKLREVAQELSGSPELPQMDLAETKEEESEGLLFNSDAILLQNEADIMLGEQIIRDIVRKATEETSCEARGFMEGDASQFIEAANVQPVVPWFQQVNQSISSALADEQKITRRRLNRRNPEYGFGRITVNATQAAFIIDTSGSMGKDQLKGVNTQLDFIAQQVDEVVVVHCDAGVAKHEIYQKGMKLEEFFGRGGTSFEPALCFVRDELEEMPNVVIYFTDGVGERLDDSDPIIAPWETRLLWILTPNGYSEELFRNRITRHGEVIKVEEWV